MDITDKEMAKILTKSLDEIEELKKNNEAEYRVLKIGALCRKLNLNTDDLLKIHDKKVAVN